MIEYTYMEVITLQTSIEKIPRVGVAYAKKLKKFGIKTVQDLLFYFPARYDDFSQIVTIAEARNKLGETACVQGEIIEIETTKSFYNRMAITKAVIQDLTAQINVMWFNQPYLEKSLKENDFICLAGKVSLSKEGLYFNSPAYERINEIGENEELTHTGRIVPVYSENRGVTSRWLRYVI